MKILIFNNCVLKNQQMSKLAVESDSITHSQIVPSENMSDNYKKKN